MRTIFLLTWLDGPAASFRRKQKGVNPLAVKKKQKKPDAAPGTQRTKTGDSDELEVSTRRLRQRERQRRRVRQRVRHKRPETGRVSTGGDDVDESVGEDVNDVEVASSAGSETGSASEDGSEDVQEDAKAISETTGRQPVQVWEQSVETLRCYCSLVPDSQFYGKGKWHFERGPTAKYPNRGRKFYCCGQGMASRHSRCSYFAWAEPQVDLSTKQQGPGSKTDSNATLSDKLLQAAHAEQGSANTSSSNGPVVATTMEDLQNLTPAAALRKLKKLDRQIAELAKKAADGMELTAQQKTKLGRESDVKKMLSEAEKAAVKAAFAAPQLVIKQPLNHSETPADGIAKMGHPVGEKDGTVNGVDAATPSTQAPVQRTSEGGFLAASTIPGMDPVSVWYTAVANWIRSKPAGGTGLGESLSFKPRTTLSGRCCNTSHEFG